MEEDKVGARALIVEDDMATGRLFCRILENSGHRCTIAENAAEARILMERAHYDLMLCDIRMPGESGLEFIDDVMHCLADTAVVMVTGEDAPRASRKAIALGVYGYLIKPVEKSQLTVSVNNALHRLRLERERRLQLQRLERTVKVLREARLKVVKQQRQLIEQERYRLMLQMAGAVAHEMNQPLTILLGYIEMLQINRSDLAKIHHYAEKIKGAGKRIADIVRQIKSLHRYETRPYAGGEKIIDIHQQQ